MRPVTRTSAILLVLLLAGCAGDRQAPSSAESAPAAPARVEGVAGGRAARADPDSLVWLTRQRTLDFTGDGLPDTVRLLAIGRVPDSLRIALTFRSQGAERWREEWASAYELVAPPPPAGETARAEFVRMRLDRALSSVEVEPFDATSYRTMADPVDSAVLRRPPPRQVSFAYGYETTVVLAWDPAARRLRLLHACC